MNRSKAVVLLSGGINSAVTLAVAQHHGYDCHTLAFDYGQRNLDELDAAWSVADSLDIAPDNRTVIGLDTQPFRSSQLVVHPHLVPRQAGTGLVSDPYVSARSLIFLSNAVAVCEGLNARAIFIGTSSVGYTSHPDRRPHFINAFERVANFATRLTDVLDGFIRIAAPLQHSSKAETIKRGMRLDVDLGLTRSCYNPGETVACLECGACHSRAKGFDEAGIEDPLLQEAR